MYKVFFIFLSISFLFFSCKNDDSDPQIEEANFYALNIGNNWEYEYFRRIGQSDEFESMGIIEDVLITETFVIEGENFFTFQSTTTGNDNLSQVAPENGVTTKKFRDSLGFLIDQNHSILYSSENLTDYLRSDELWGDIYGVLKDGTETVVVPAGEFNCTQNEIYVIVESTGNMAPGRDRYYFKDGVGEIYKEYSSVSNPQHNWEKRLIRFEILN